MRAGLFATVLRAAMTAAYRALRLRQRLTGRRRPGVHGLVLTPAGDLVLVRLTYAPGWHLPGGGRRRGEAAETGLLRELREEIGLRSWTSVEPADRRPPVVGPDRDALFVVRGAVHRPRWSFEIAEVRAFPRDRLPDTLTPWTRAMVAWWSERG